jgi:hypothetical protein
VYCFRVAFVIFASLSLLEQLAKRDVFRGQGQTGYESRIHASRLEQSAMLFWMMVTSELDC